MQSNGREILDVAKNFPKQGKAELCLWICEEFLLLTLFIPDPLKSPTQPRDPVPSRADPKTCKAKKGEVLEGNPGKGLTTAIDLMSKMPRGYRDGVPDSGLETGDKLLSELCLSKAVALSLVGLEDPSLDSRPPPELLELSGPSFKN